ncbi:MAG: hypothetical protein IT323_10440, partial [Anaerolineae bacterium]|nr:hypothetical protein [Anaerolineae bacterium]
MNAGQGEGLGPAARELLLLIARCPIVAHCLSDAGGDHPCATVVRSQRALHDGPHQSPAPWNGDLEHAPLLFVGSNPTIHPDELHPTAEWPDDQIVDFFVRRFGGGQRAWTREHKYALLRDGTYAKHWSRYWAAVRTLARALYGLEADQPIRPGVDYVTSAVVHCKSREEIGVSRARKTCAGNYLDLVFRTSGAAVIVCLGKHA